MLIVDLEAFVLQDRLLRKIEKAINNEWNHERLDPYCRHDNGGPGTRPGRVDQNVARTTFVRNTVIAADAAAHTGCAFLPLVFWDAMEKRISTPDPDNGMFVKGERRRRYAYEARTVCDNKGFMLERIERVYADAKEKHAKRYTHPRGLTAVTRWVGDEQTAANLKKPAIRSYSNSRLPAFGGGSLAYTQ